MRSFTNPLVLAAVLAASTAYAEPVPQKARSLADRGRIAHDQRDYAGAIAAFTEAYAIAPSPALLFNLAQAYRLKGSCDDALLLYRRYLRTNPSDDGRVLAEAHLATVERCIQNRPHVTVDPQLRTINTIAIPKPPVEAFVAGKQSRNERSYTQKLGAGLTIGGGTALLIAAYYGLQARDASNEVERRYADGEKWPKLASLDAEGDRAASISKAAAVTGIAAIATGVTLLVVDRKKRHHTLRIEPTTRGARIGARWDF